MNCKQLILMTFVALSYACTDGKKKEEATTLSNKFFAALSKSDESLAKKLYPGFDEFSTYYKSDSAQVQDVVVKDTVVMVRVLNRFTNGMGKSTQQEIWLYMKKRGDSAMFIEDTKGLSDFSEKDAYKFGIRAGCIDAAIDTTDQRVLRAMRKADKVMVDKAVEMYRELKKGCVVETWSWDSGYSGSASGKGIVRNNTTYSIPSVKYKVTYMRSDGTEVTTDDGYVSVDALKAGSSRSFTFYTSYVGSASNARIELTFKDELILS